MSTLTASSTTEVSIWTWAQTLKSLKNSSSQFISVGPPAPAGAILNPCERLNKHTDIHMHAFTSGVHYLYVLNCLTYAPRAPRYVPQAMTYVNK